PVPHRPSVVLLRRSPLSSLFPYTTLFRSLAILDRDYAGIYAIHVAENYRGLHIGRSICLALLNAAAEQGAFSAYLQVVKGNLPAKSLYRSLGFKDFYTYWFRQQYHVKKWENHPSEK